MCAGYQILFTPGGQLAGACHPYGSIGLCAQAAKGALAEVQRQGARAGAVGARESAGRASRHGRACVLPMCEINLGSSPRLTRQLGGGQGIRGCHDARSKTLAEDLEHNLTVGAGVGQVEALIYHREIRDNIAKDGLAQGGPVL
jgi:hypothetical protein